MVKAWKIESQDGQTVDGQSSGDAMLGILEHEMRWKTPS